MSAVGRNNPTGLGRPLRRGDDTRVAPVALFATLIAAVVGACIVLSIPVVRHLMQSRERSDAPSASSASAPPPPEPRLQAFPRQDLDVMLSQKQQLLHSYGFIDRRAGIVRIPITRAIELATERGLKLFSAEPSAAAAAPRKEEP